MNIKLHPYDFVALDPKRVAGLNILQYSGTRPASKSTSIFELENKQGQKWRECDDRDYNGPHVVAPSPGQVVQEGLCNDRHQIQRWNGADCV